MARRRRARKREGRQSWSAAEVRRLKKLFRNMATVEVAAKLGRSVGSVQGKASTLGLTKTRRYLKSIGKAK